MRCLALSTAPPTAPTVANKHHPFARNHFKQKSKKKKLIFLFLNKLFLSLAQCLHTDHRHHHHHSSKKKKKNYFSTEKKSIKTIFFLPQLQPLFFFFLITHYLVPPSFFFSHQNSSL